MQEEVAQRAAGEDSEHACRADHEEHERAEGLGDSVLLRHELDAEGLHAREEVVAARARQDDCHVGLDREHVARCRQQSHPPGVLRQDERGVRLEAAVERDPLRVGGLLAVVVNGLGHRRLHASREQCAGAATGGLRQLEDEPGEHKGRQRENHGLAGRSFVRYATARSR